MSRLVGNIATIALIAGAASAATPIVKTGDCPTLPRHAAAPDDHWNQFGIRPNPPEQFPVNTIQNSLTPEQSINCIETQPGLKVELWASEKSPGGIAYLQDFTFDERGRLWAVEPRSYPNIIRTASNSITDQKFVGGLDRIVILEDTDGDKVMDKFKVFRDGLNLPQGIEVVNGGVVVAMVPYVVFFPNENDTAGTPQILFSGMGSSGNYDTHGGINSLMYGLDNWIYGHTGYNGCNVKGVDCGHGKVWRFRHTALGHAKTEFQVWSSGPANAHGIGQMEDGQIFLAGATGTSHMNHAAVMGKNAMDIRTVNPAYPSSSNPANVFYPITGDRYLWEGSTGKNAQGWFTSSTTAVSGLQFYTSRLFPKKYWNRFAFTCEGASKLCNQDSLVVSGKGDIIGSSWRAIRLPGPDHANILASKDAWVAPILAKTGPDGAVWVLDWNDYLFLHNPASPSGPGGAWENELRNKTTNRIYRITPTGATPEPILNLSTASTDQLVATFANPNFLWRLQAQRLLLAKGYSPALGDQLKAILQQDKSVDSVGNNPRVIHALWTLDGLGRFTAEPAVWNPILAGLLKHPSVGVRRNVLRVMPRTTETAQAIGTACSVNDDHGHVRLQALLALSEIQSKPANLPAIWTSYRDVDTTAKSAVAAAGIATAAAKPCSPVLDAVVSVAKPDAGPAPRTGLRFALRAEGFDLMPHGSLVSGMLSVYDLHGRIVFTSRYDAASMQWNRSSARGLTQRIYGYDFRGTDGSLMRGHLALMANR